MKISFLKKYQQKNYISLFFLIIISPVIASLFWLIADPLLGNLSPRIMYGNVIQVPKNYQGIWKGYDNYDLEKLTISKLNLNLFILDGNEKSNEQCKAEDLNIGYKMKNIQEEYGRIAQHFFALLPRTLFGNQVINITCKNSTTKGINSWELIEQKQNDFDKPCISLNIRYINEEQPFKLSLCKD